MYIHVALLSALVVRTLAIAEPMITPAAQLVPRAVDPAFVGYITANGAYTDGRTCDYPQTVSTSGNYVQCCPTTGACAFYTSCSGNTLFAGSTSVPCDINSALTCNTAIVLATPSADNRGSYLACWQRTLGTGVFTFVQDTQGASGNTATSGSSSSGSISSLSTLGTGGSTTGTSGGSATASSTSATRNVAAADEASLSSGGVIGLLALLAQAFL